MALKHSHMMFALISGAFFALRGVWMIMDSHWLQKRWVRIVPHVNDSLLLLCAVGLMVVTGMYPGAHAWLTAKLVALVVYIGLGVVALKPGRPKPVRVGAWVAALACFFYMLSVAIHKSPMAMLAG